MSVKHKKNQEIMRKKDPHYHHVNFFLMAAAAILLLMDSSQKVIRSSEIPREQPYQILMQSNQRLIIIVPTSFLGGHLGKWPHMAWWQKKCMG